MKANLRLDTDVLVLGSGPSGFAAAYTAAKNNAKVILIESAGSLGGTVTESFMGNLIDADGKGSLIDELRDFLNAHDMTCPLRGAKADENGKNIPGNIQNPGYSEKWKRAVAADNGEILKVVK